MDIKLTLAVSAGKIIALILKITGTGATAAPGLYALKIDANLVKKIARHLPKGSIIISGTNGKTTTSRLAFEMLSSKYKVIHNRQGSNLLRGIASTLIKKSSLTGKVNAELGLWEIDEGILPEAIDNFLPETIVLLNLFRDQLDRYGEVDTTRRKWQEAVSKLPKSATLILNSDDPGISILAEKFKGKIVYFGVNDKKINLPQVTNVADIKYCLNCAKKLNYQTILSAHLGDYYCPNCNLKRPLPQIFANNLLFRKDFSTSASLTINNKQSLRSSQVFDRESQTELAAGLKPLTINYFLPGLYNVYNILAAASIATSEKIEAKIIKEKIQNYSSVFGRFQSVKIHDKSAVIFLIKNPAGANEILRTLALNNKLNLLVILNDKIADGKDVSWIWDAGWEILKNKITHVSVAGNRRWDIALRLKYAGFKLSKNSIYKEISYSISDSLSKLNNNDTLIMLPTYTALLEVQKTLSKLTGEEKWHEQ